MLNRLLDVRPDLRAKPRLNRPAEYDCRSQPRFATVIGLRAKATAMLVPTSSRDVCSAASSTGRNGS